MSLTHSEIFTAAESILKQTPFRTKFERENFLYSTSSGPRLLVALCNDIIDLNEQHENATTEWIKAAILVEMNIINNRIKELQIEFPNINTALEESEGQYWTEHLAQKAAIEAICMKVSVENMTRMLALPAEMYEEAITRCQTLLNVINKTTRAAERKADTRT